MGKIFAMPAPVALNLTTPAAPPPAPRFDLWGVMLGVQLTNEKPRAATMSEVEAYLCEVAHRRGIVVPRGATFGTSGIFADGAYILDMPGLNADSCVTLEELDASGEVLRTSRIGTDRKGHIGLKADAVRKACDLPKARKPRATKAAADTPVKVKVATINRANRALAMFRGDAPGMGTRKLDNCFEAGDGDAVGAIILERLRDAGTARAVLRGRSSFRDQGERVDVSATAHLPYSYMAAALDTLGEPSRVYLANSDTIAKVDALRVNLPATPQNDLPETHNPADSFTPAPVAQAPAQPEPIIAPVCQPELAQAAPVAVVEAPAPVPVDSALLARLEALEAVVARLTRPAVAGKRQRSEAERRAILRAWRMRGEMRARADLDRRALEAGNVWARAEAARADNAQEQAANARAAATAYKREMESIAVAHGRAMNRADRLARVAIASRTARRRLGDDLRGARAEGRALMRRLQDARTAPVPAMMTPRDSGAVAAHVA